jgi:hypothetical protein
MASAGVVFHNALAITAITASPRSIHVIIRADRPAE